MSRQSRARLHDIEEAITQLLASTKGRTLADLTTDWLYGQACLHAIQTIGEAANHLPGELQDRYPEIPWRKVIMLSHRLRHEYFRIDADIIWEVITVHLPPLHLTIKKMIADLSQPDLPL